MEVAALKLKPIEHLRTLYDVQQLLERFNVLVHLGKRTYDIELMALEIDNLYRSRVISKDLFMQAKLVLQKEYRLSQQEEPWLNLGGKKNG